MFFNYLTNILVFQETSCYWQQNSSIMTRRWPSLNLKRNYYPLITIAWITPTILIQESPDTDCGSAFVKYCQTLSSQWFKPVQTIAETPNPGCNAILSTYYI